jgi:nuclear receptor subfamily 0 group A
MSKSGSRYGRRSNWFKIHCLLSEQQQQRDQLQQKASALSPNSLNLMRHPSYASNLFSRPPCTSPSISSPDSHNSDSSIEIGDKMNSTLSKQNKHALNMQQHQQSLALNKDLFLPLPFSGFPLMPPPGFLPPPTHFLFSNYQNHHFNALYEQNHHFLQQQVQQGLLKTSDVPMTFLSKTSSIEKDENNCDEDDRVKVEQHFENESKRKYSEILLQSQHSLSVNSLLTKVPKKSSSPYPVIKERNEDDDIQMNESDEVLTPPRSPKSPHRAQLENNPIDLSMKSGSSTKSDDINHNYYKSQTNNKSSSDSCLMNVASDSDSNDHKTNSINRKTIHCHDLKDGYNGKHFRGHESEEDDNYRHESASDDRCDEVDEYEGEMKRRKLNVTTPLDLTTKF